MTFTLDLDLTLTLVYIALQLTLALISIALQLSTLWFCTRGVSERITPPAKAKFKIPKVFSTPTPANKPVMVNEEMAASLELSQEKDRFYLDD